MKQNELKTFIANTLNNSILKLTLLIFLFFCVENSAFPQRTSDISTFIYELPKPNKKYKYYLTSEKFKKRYPNFISLSTSVTFIQKDVFKYSLTQNYISYKYITLFSDGRFFMSFSYNNSPTKKELCDYEYGKFGYYALFDNCLLMEYYYNREYGLVITTNKFNGNRIDILGYSYGLGRTWSDLRKVKDKYVYDPFLRCENKCE
jgi:hypothetical protein